MANDDSDEDGGVMGDSDKDEDLTLNLDDDEAVRVRLSDWQQYRMDRDVVYKSMYSASIERTLAFLVGDASLAVWIPVKNLWSLIACYANVKEELYVARMRVLDLFDGYDAVEAVNGLDDRELISVEAQVSSFDPQDGHCGDPQFRDSCWYLSRDRRRQKFSVVFQKCEGCQKMLWVGIDHPKDSQGYRRLQREDVNWLDPDTFPPYNCFVCGGCKNECYCTNRMEFYERSCEICGVSRCKKHDFRESANENRTRWTPVGRNRCDHCLQLLRLGRTFADILRHPEPHAALDTFIATQSSTKSTH